MFFLWRNGSKFLPNLIYFRLTPAKKVFISFNTPQLRFIAHKKLVERDLAAEFECSDCVEKVKQLCSHMTSEESDLVDAQCEKIRSDVLSALESLYFEVNFKKAVDEDYSILRIFQPYDKMEDWLDPLLWSLASDGVKVLESTPIFNEGIARDGIEFQSVLALISIPEKVHEQFPLHSKSFPQTEIDVLAHSFKCQDCVTVRNSKPCPHCKFCVHGRECTSLRGLSCEHSKLYRLE